MRRHIGKNERCPIHGGFYCCGRESKRSHRLTQAIHITEDGRVVCSEEELHRRKLRMMAEHPFCAVCEILDPANALFTDMRQVHLGHRESKGHGGAKHNDAWENLALIHSWENIEMGSMSFEAYILKKQLERKRGLSPVTNSFAPRSA